MRLDGELAMCLLEHRAHIDDGIDVGARRRILADRRVLAVGEKIAQRLMASRRDGSSAVGERRIDPPAPVRLDDVAELHRLGVGETDDRRRMEAHADRESLGQMLMRRLAGEHATGDSGSRCRRCSGRAARSSAASPRGRASAAFLRRSSAKHRGPLAIEVDELLGDRLPLGRIGVQQMRRGAACAAPRRASSRD